VSAPAIAVDGLEVRYPGAAGAAVDGMSFEVAPGEVFGFLGPNGAGKSTTQRVLTRLLRGYTGQVAVLGRPLSAWDASYYRRIGVGFELPAFYGKLTAAENLAAFRRLYGGATEDPAALLAQLDLVEAADRQARHLSKGMAMRLNLARALLHRPALLFLDEPTSGLDPVHAAAVRTVVRDRAQAGCTVFLTTHDMAAADQLCDRVAFVVDGRIASVGTPRQLKLDHGRRVVDVEHRGAGGLERSSFALDGLGGGSPDASRFAALLASGTVETIHTREASLDGVFAAVTGRAL
jgi:fluoroquinolone transport system ATP-binding protein